MALRVRGQSFSRRRGRPRHFRTPARCLPVLAVALLVVLVLRLNWHRDNVGSSIGDVSSNTGSSFYSKIHPRSELVFSNRQEYIDQKLPIPMEYPKEQQERMDRLKRQREQRMRMSLIKKTCPKNNAILPMCDNAANISGFSSNCETVRKSGTYFSSRWGNVISSYWAARTMAELAGYNYSGAPFGNGTWMQYLPTAAKAYPPKPELFSLACECESPDGDFHACTHSSGYIADTIATDMRAAIRKHAESQPKEVQDAIFDWKATDWLIYDRCCLTCPPQGFVNIHAFDVLPQSGNYTVYTLTQKNADQYEGGGLCGKLHQLRDDYIRVRNSNVNIVPLEGADLFVDWSRCIFAPNYLSASAGSSWLFFTSLSNTGNVHVGRPQLRRLFDRSAMPKRLHIFEDDAMTPPQAERLLNTSIQGTYDDFISTRSGQEQVLEWFVADTGMNVDMNLLTRQE